VKTGSKQGQADWVKRLTVNRSEPQMVVRPSCPTEGNTAPLPSALSIPLPFPLPFPLQLALPLALPSAGLRAFAIARTLASHRGEVGGAPVSVAGSSGSALAPPIPSQTLSSAPFVCGNEAGAFVVTAAV